jgi:hypothetical protein
MLPADTLCLQIVIGQKPTHIYELAYDGIRLGVTKVK